MTKNARRNQRLNHGVPRGGHFHTQRNHYAADIAISPIGLTRQLSRSLGSAQSIFNPSATNCSAFGCRCQLLLHHSNVKSSIHPSPRRHSPLRYESRRILRYLPLHLRQRPLGSRTPDPSERRGRPYSRHPPANSTRIVRPGAPIEPNPRPQSQLLIAIRGRVKRLRSVPSPPILYLGPATITANPETRQPSPSAPQPSHPAIREIVPGSRPGWPRRTQ